MRKLSDIYESARINIPLRTFPERKSVPAWEDLDEQVCSELEILEKKVLSVLTADNQLLTNNQRVIGEFNRGVRKGFFADPQDINPAETGNEMSLGPFQWGRGLGIRAKLGRETNPALIKHFITATHLLAYEFGQLDQAFSNPYDFLIRNVGPERADEFGELVFALPILINYRRSLLKGLLDAQEFSFTEHNATQVAAPSHIEYLEHGLIALFDPEPENWTRVAANFGLATRPFRDGQTMQSEHFQAPLQAAITLYNKPIAAHTVVQRQVKRIELARNWIGAQWTSFDIVEESNAPVTLWDVYKGTEAASIRGQDDYFGDLIASNSVSQLSEYFEDSIGEDDIRFSFMRMHLSAFTCGFDAHVESAVDPRAIVSAARGRAISDGLRRLENGGIYVGGVCKALQELGETMNELHYALENPVGFMRETLERNNETPIAACLLELFQHHPKLPEVLFSEDTEYEFNSRTQIQTNLPFDLIRSVLFHVTLAVRPTIESADDVKALLATARRHLGQLVNPAASAPTRNRPTTPVKGRQQIILIREEVESVDTRPNEIVVAARLFKAEFDTLVRLIRNIVHPLHFARMLNKPNSAFGPSYLDRVHRRNTTRLS